MRPLLADPYENARHENKLSRKQPLYFLDRGFDNISVALSLVLFHLSSHSVMNTSRV